jgi:uncharacterized membrane protein YdjX (TVP38/TMEM64 family)
MPQSLHSRWFPIGIGLLIVVALAVLFWGRQMWELLIHAYGILTDRESLKSMIKGFGPEAPFIFIGLQVLQVIFAPVPGEASGFLGGFLFGTLNGFVYSTVGLTLGSWLGFLLGRFLGTRYVRKLIPADRLSRMDRFFKRQGVIVILILFILPGFPKDYLCLLLGATALPLKVFMVISTLGRMPGTLMLSVQGASVYAGNYLLFSLVAIPCFVCGMVAWYYRERLYLWVDRLNHR